MKPTRTVFVFFGTLVAGLALAVGSAPGATPAAAPFPGKQSDCRGYQRYDFVVDGCPTIVVVPKQAAAGKPWVWRAEFFDAFPQVDLALLGRGFHLVYISVGNTFGCPDALKHWDVLYKELTEKHGLSRKPVLEGLSRGGLYCFNWAADHPEKVACILADNAVLDFKSWPGGKGKGKGSPGDWKKLQQDYHFQSEAEALAYTKNPVDNLAPLAKAKVPLFLLCGDADDVVPYPENGAIVKERYEKLGGPVRVADQEGLGPSSARPGRSRRRSSSTSSSIRRLHLPRPRTPRRAPHPGGCLWWLWWRDDRPREPSRSPAELRMPFGVDADRAGNLFIVELTGQRLRKLNTAGRLSTVAGTGEKGHAGDGGAATAAQFNGMHNLAVAPNGDLFIADTWNCRVRKIDAKTGVITTVAGTGVKGYSGDGGPADQAQCGDLYCVALDAPRNRLLLADLDNRRIRVVTLVNGKIETLAGNGRRGVPSDGSPAKEAPLVDPRAVACDAVGNVYILERAGHALRAVDGQGRIRTVAGTGTKGTAADDVPAAQATFDGPKHLCVDGHGDVIIADAENHVVRKLLVREKRVVRVAGTGKPGSAGVGGPPSRVELDRPHGVFVDPQDTLFIADSGNDRILRIQMP